MTEFNWTEEDIVKKDTDIFGFLKGKYAIILAENVQKLFKVSSECSTFWYNDDNDEICIVFKHANPCPNIPQVLKLPVWTTSFTANWANQLQLAAVNS